MGTATGSSALPTVDFDHNDLSVTSEARRRQYAEMAAECPVARVDGYGGFDLVSGYEPARDIAMRADEFSSSDGVFIPPNELPRIPALEYDGEEHALWRGLMAELLTPAAVRELEPMVTEVVSALIDTFASEGSAELASAFAEPIPAIVIGRYVGLSTEESMINRELASTAFSAIGTPSFESSMGKFAEYTLDRMRERRSSPKGDFLSLLASGEYKGIEIDDSTAVQIFVALLVGGHHSTASGISGFINHALQDIDIRDALAHDTKLLTRAVDESLRLTTPLQSFARTATAECPVGDHTIPAGTRVLLNFAAANRDEKQFANPDRLDLTRRRNPHLAFGVGPHQCVGQHLARLELRVALSELLRRLPDIHLAGKVETSGLVAGNLMTITTLPVAFTPEVQ